MTIKFGNITIQAKDKRCDWRSFVICWDGVDRWELRGYGATPEEAARDAYNNFNDRENWDMYGYILPPIVDDKE